MDRLRLTETALGLRQPQDDVAVVLALAAQPGEPGHDQIIEPDEVFAPTVPLRLQDVAWLERRANRIIGGWRDGDLDHALRLLTSRFDHSRLGGAIKSVLLSGSRILNVNMLMSICPKRSSIVRIALSYSFGEEGKVLMSSVHGSAEEHQICRRGGISDRCFIAPSRKLRTVVFSTADA